MKKKSEELATLEATKRAEISAILAKDEPTPEEFTKAKSLKAEVEQLVTDRATAEEMEALEVSNKAAEKALRTTSPNPHQHSTQNADSGGNNGPGIVGDNPKLYEGFESMKRFGSLKAFNGEFAGKTRQEQEQKAYRFGRFMLTVLTQPGTPQNQKAIQWCDDHGMELKVATETINSGGGYLVPEEFNDVLIDLREQYGVFRKYCKMTPMKTDTQRIMRRTAGLTAYYVGENQAPTATDKVWSQVQLVAKKIATLSKYSSEIAEDALINIGDDLAEEIAYAFAYTEDLAGFTGTGTSATGGIIGVPQKILNISSTLSHIAGLQIAPAGSGAAFTSFVLADFEGTVGLLPQYADQPMADPAWYVHRTFYWNVMRRLELAAGGNAVSNIQMAAGAGGAVVTGAGPFMFMGYPVRITQVLPSVPANSTIFALFGSLKLSTAFGDRRQTTIAMSEHSDFANDIVALRGTERYDINVHDVGGDNSLTPAGTPGPIVALASASS